MASQTTIALANAVLAGSPLAGKGAAFVLSGERHDVDWRLLIAIAWAETSLGRTGNAQALHNPFGLGPGIRFNSWEDAIDRAAEVIAGYRRDRGADTVAEVGAIWAPVGAGNDPRNLNSNWVRNVTAFLGRLDGDPSSIGFPGSSAIGPEDAGAVGDAVSGAVTGAIDAAAATARLAAALTERNTWIRVGLGAGGLLALGLGAVVVWRSVRE